MLISRFDFYDAISQSVDVGDEADDKLLMNRTFES